MRTPGLLFGQGDDLGAAEVHFESAVFDEDAAPDDFARLGDAVQGRAAEREVHGRLAVAVAAFPATDVMFDRGGFIYHGRVKALADAAREGGLSF